MPGAMWDGFERHFRGGRDRTWKALCDLWGYESESCRSWLVLSVLPDWEAMTFTKGARGGISFWRKIMNLIGDILSLVFLQDAFAVWDV